MSRRCPTARLEDASPRRSRQFIAKLHRMIFQIRPIFLNSRLVDGLVNSLTHRAVESVGGIFRPREQTRSRLLADNGLRSDSEITIIATAAAALAQCRGERTAMADRVLSHPLRFMKRRPGARQRKSKYRAKCLFFDRPEIIDFGLGGPGRPGNLTKRWRVSPTIFLERSPAARGRPDLQDRRFPVGQKIMY